MITLLSLSYIDMQRFKCKNWVFEMQMPRIRPLQVVQIQPRLALRTRSLHRLYRLYPRF